MKFGNLIHNGLAKGAGKRIINLGDSFEILAIEQLYKKMGISKHNIIDIDIYSLGQYDGDYLILPINFNIVPSLFGIDILKVSDKIIPVFLGLSLAQTSLTPELEHFFKCYEPIGCRDERTMILLRKHGIISYMSGCLVSTLKGELCSDGERNTVFIIDAPKGIEPFIPQSLKQFIKYTNHEFFVSEADILKDISFKRKALKQIQMYCQEAKLIVTSRFHAAVIGIALGIPVILAAENNFYKFSWLSKILPFYEHNCFDKIDWEPSPVNFAVQKRTMEDIAIYRIQQAFKTYHNIYKLSSMLEFPGRSDADSLLYYHKAIEYIQNNWEPDNCYNYAFWGINQNAEEIYQFISSHYSKACLSLVYDGFSRKQFHGLESCTPTEASCNNHLFIFVTSNTASYPAEELFKKINKTDYFLCRLEFMGKP